jgi:hypothetical protein
MIPPVAQRSMFQAGAFHGRRGQWQPPVHVSQPGPVATLIEQAAEGVKAAGA